MMETEILPTAITSAMIKLLNSMSQTGGDKCPPCMPSMITVR